MPSLSRWYIKAGLLYLVIALTLGALTVIRPAFIAPALLSGLYPVFLHLFIVGWITQLIFGIAYWMFPKQSKEQPRGDIRIARVVFVLLNTGLCLRAIGEPALAVYPGSAVGSLLGLSAILQVLAGWLFVASIWGRVKER
ncbi:MAG: hypothetical protein UZ15_CFX003002670 [Chloroflexi bacterium OLB15]|nr:MAG: hypothetical protein UZ15_CFX003002670 [Chloroflexi bacterium OLB15]